MVINMIIAQTKLKKIPDKCNKCKFCTDVGVGRKASKACFYAVAYMKKKCFITGSEVPYVYNETKHNWEYTKCKNCPLVETT